jgi:hypothetical protein
MINVIKREKYTIIFLLLISIIILIPLITKNHIYNNITGYDQPRSDFRDFTTMISGWMNGNEVRNDLYLARMITGYPMGVISNATGINIDTICIIFYFLSLIIITVAMYLIVSRLFGVGCGIFSIAASVFCSTGILAMFKYGMNASILNMYLVLPLAIIMTTKWFDQKKIVYLVLALFFFGFFSLFHLTSLYLPYAIGMSIFTFLTYWIIKKKNMLRMIIFLLCILSINIIISHFAFPGETALNNMAINNISSTTSIEEAHYLSNTPLTITFFIFNYLSISVLGLLILLVILLPKYWKEIVVKEDGKMLLMLLSGFAIVLGAGTFLPLSPEPVRTATDFATILSLVVAIVLYQITKQKNLKVIKIVSCLLVLLGIVPNLIEWIK